METNNKCIICNKETKNKTFCSKKCQSIDFKNKQKKCSVCGKSTPNKVYCSEKCQHIGSHGIKPEKWETIDCLNCGINIKRLKSRKNKQFCSKQCKNKYELNNNIGIYNSKNRILNHSDETKLKHKVYDFLILKKNILIEVDGDYLHGNPKIFPNPNKTQKIAILNDIYKNELANKNNLKLFRYWENEIFLDSFECKLINDINNEK